MEESVQKNLHISVDMGSGGIKENYNVPESLVQYDTKIESDTEIILITPDMGKRTDNDPYFIPNLHNGLFRIHAF
ncbi:MAG: hypothetical protein AABX99_00280, partial [Nanoarchaeota archaeon]